MSAEAPSYCALIPVYNHHAVLGGTVDELVALGLPVFLIDDGSDEQTRRQVAALANSQVNVSRLARNQGKGAAVCHGFKMASAGGYSHALQIDADGQHQVQDVRALLACSRRMPDKVIAGARCYAEMPSARRRGRRFTDMWVNINTLSRSIADSMCGLRIYPLAPTMTLLGARPIGRRMEFDTDIAVRLYWHGVAFENLPVKVSYPSSNTSHFHLIRDNARITLMHTRHFFLMLAQLPSVLQKRFTRRNAYD